MGDNYINATAGTFTTFWTGESGDAAGVVRWLNDLLIDFQRTPGHDHEAYAKPQLRSWSVALTCGFQDR
jgi:hypothetical protein